MFVFSISKYLCIQFAILGNLWVLRWLIDLEFIDLSYNSFEGYLAHDMFQRMYHLDLLRLHGNNKLTGVVEIAASDDLFGPSSFVADCGKPSMFEEPIMYKGCTMCCKFLVFSNIYVRNHLLYSLANIPKSLTCCMNDNISLFKATHRGSAQITEKILWRNGDSKIFKFSQSRSS